MSVSPGLDGGIVVGASAGSVFDAIVELGSETALSAVGESSSLPQALSASAVATASGEMRRR